MVDAIPNTIILPADAARTIIAYADRELGRLEQWRTVGVPSARAEAEDLREAITEAASALNDAAVVALPMETAAVLRLYAGREFARLASLSAQWGDGDTDLSRQATELLSALRLIPYVARPLNLPPAALPANTPGPGTAAEVVAYG